MVEVVINTEEVRLELEREEGSIYAYESVDGVNWQLVTAVVLSLTNTSQPGMTAFAQMGEVVASLEQIEVVSDDKIVPDFTASTMSGLAPLTVDVSAIPVQAEDASYYWNFGTIDDAEGTTSSYTFAEPGEYIITLKVQSGDTLRTATKVVKVTWGDAAVTQRPFTINTGEVGESVRISAFAYGEAYTDSATTVPVSNPSEDVVNYYALFDENSVIAMDVVIPGVKEDINFNARNSVLATALYAPPEFYGVPTDLMGEFYKRFSAHPDFNSIVERVREGRQLYNSSDTSERIIKLAIDVARNYLQEQGEVPGTHLPGVVKAGTYIGQGAREFWCVHYTGNAVVFELEALEYTRAVVDVRDPEAVVQRVRAAQVARA